MPTILLRFSDIVNSLQMVVTLLYWISVYPFHTNGVIIQNVFKHGITFLISFLTFAFRGPYVNSFEPILLLFGVIYFINYTISRKVWRFQMYSVIELKTSLEWILLTLLCIAPLLSHLVLFKVTNSIMSSPPKEVFYPIIEPTTEYIN